MKRNPEYYSRELLQAARRFDSAENQLALNIIDNFNEKIVREPEFKDIFLNLSGKQGTPKNIVWIDASQDKLPATSEAARVSGEGRIVNSRQELLTESQKNRTETLFLSQCVKKDCYDKNLSIHLEKKGSVTSPGPVTAPGGLFSNKLKTYKLLSRKYPNNNLIANFKDVPVDKSQYPKVTAGKILDAVDGIKKTKSFFIKPPEGGGGLGGFRLVKVSRNGNNNYIIPDLSRVSGDTTRPRMINLTVDAEKPEILEELWWIYNYFKEDPVLSKNYIKTNIRNISELKKVLETRKNPKNYSRKEAIAKLSGSITKFENKFNRKYHPIVNHYIDFGSWGLRAHYRLTGKGIQLETVYARIFQIRFSKKGIGYVGADNISNKQTGELELARLVPINKLMVEAAGGQERLYRILKKGALGLKALLETLPPSERSKVPLRVQFDLAPAGGLIGEANSDTARGFCLAQNFESFIKNTRQWFKDSLKYYRYKKQLYEPR